MLVEVVSALSVVMDREESRCCWPCVRKVAGNKRLEVVASEDRSPATAPLSCRNGRLNNSGE
jgi:hypothetical protein